MKNTAINYTEKNMINKGEKTMKKTTIKTRIIAGVLSVFTVFSAAAFATTSASAAEAAQNDMTIVKVGDEEKAYNDFAQAWANATSVNGATVKINSSELRNLANLTIPSGKNMTVDLGGNTIRTGSKLFNVEKGAECTIKNGKIERAETAVTANGNVNLIGVTISGAKDSAVKGGKEAKVIIDGCSFRSNNGVQGGAVYLPYRTEGTVIRNSFFENNEARQEGAAVYTCNAVYNSIFNGNVSHKDGGAIYMAGGEEDIRDCSFEKNFTFGNGGAIAVTRSENYINNCNFRRNHSEKSGGAIYALNGKDVISSGCRFDGNVAHENGGAIYMGDRSYLKLTEAELTNNEAYINGGAVYLGGLMSKNHDFSNVVITDNDAHADGGGVYAIAEGMKSADVNFVNKIVVKNNKKNDFYLVNATLKKAKIYTREEFDVDESCVYVNSSDKGETAVVDLYEKNDERAFRANDGRSLSRGFIFSETLYIK